jgi:hypothetical protein
MVSPRRLRGQSDLTVSRIDAMTLDGARSELSGGTSEQVNRVLEDFAKALGVDAVSDELVLRRRGS